MISNSIRLVVATFLLGLTACATSPQVTVEPPEPFALATTFAVEEIAIGIVTHLGLDLSDHTATHLVDRGWVEHTRTAALTIRLSMDLERVLDVVHGSGRWGASVVTDVHAVADMQLAVAVVDTAGVTVWAATERVNVPLGTGRDGAQTMVLDTLDTILTAIPIGDSQESDT